MKTQSKNNLLNLPGDISRAGAISRRDAGKRLLAGMAAGAAVPWMSAGHPIWKHFENGALLERAESAAAAAKLEFLNPAQFAALVSAAETIVPGSTKAGVAPFIDLLLSVDNSKSQEEFASSLAQVEAESSQRFSKNVAHLSAEERIQLFAEMSTSAGSQAADGSALKAFLHLREWIAGSYYSSEIGQRELGWTPDRVFAEFPGCVHTDETH
jgi:gluconate 2-dehydrogenase subunit 3-like protein